MNTNPDLPNLISHELARMGINLARVPAQQVTTNTVQGPNPNPAMPRVASGKRSHAQMLGNAPAMHAGVAQTAHDGARQAKLPRLSTRETSMPADEFSDEPVLAEVIEVLDAKAQGAAMPGQPDSLGGPGMNTHVFAQPWTTQQAVNPAAATASVHHATEAGHQWPRVSGMPAMYAAHTWDPMAGGGPGNHTGLTQFGSLDRVAPRMTNPHPAMTLPMQPVAFGTPLLGSTGANGGMNAPASVSTMFFQGYFQNFMHGGQSATASHAPLFEKTSGSQTMLSNSAGNRIPRSRLTKGLKDCLLNEIDEMSKATDQVKARWRNIRPHIKEFFLAWGSVDETGKVKELYAVLHIVTLYVDDLFGSEGGWQAKAILASTYRMLASRSRALIEKQPQFPEGYGRQLKACMDMICAGWYGYANRDGALAKTVPKRFLELVLSTEEVNYGMKEVGDQRIQKKLLPKFGTLFIAGRPQIRGGLAFKKAKEWLRGNQFGDMGCADLVEEYIRSGKQSALVRCIHEDLQMAGQSSATTTQPTVPTHDPRGPGQEAQRSVPTSTSTSASSLATTKAGTRSSGNEHAAFNRTEPEDSETEIESCDDRGRPG